MYFLLPAARLTESPRKSNMAYTQSIRSSGYNITSENINPRGDAGGLSREYVLRIPSVS